MLDGDSRHSARVTTWHSERDRLWSLGKRTCRWKIPTARLHERLDRVLRISRPNVVLACYGMNCGIYQPFDTERLNKFQEGITAFMKKSKR